MSEYGSASRHWPISIALTSVFRRRTWHHCATVAAAQSPFYFACRLVIAPRTHASRVNFSAALRFPGSRVACSALVHYGRQSSFVSLPCSVVAAYRAIRTLFIIIIWTFLTYQIPARYQFFPRVLSPSTRNDIPNRSSCRCDLQVRSTTIPAILYFGHITPKYRFPVGRETDIKFKLNFLIRSVLDTLRRKLRLVTRHYYCILYINLS